MTTLSTQPEAAPDVCPKCGSEQYDFGKDFPGVRDFECGLEMRHGVTRGERPIKCYEHQLAATNARIEELQAQNAAMRSALERIGNFEGEPIWDDSRDDAARDMLSLAQEALSAIEKK